MNIERRFCFTFSLIMCTMKKWFCITILRNDFPNHDFDFDFQNHHNEMILILILKSP